MDIIKEGLLGGGGKGPQYGIIAIVLIALIFLFINVYVYNSKKIAQNKKEKKEETDQLWQEAKQKGEQETLFCHENVYEDQYDGIMPIDDMDDREYSDDSYGDRD